MMGIFNNPSPFDQDVDKITNPKNTSEDWGLIMDLCDKVSTRKDGPKDCLKSITKRLQNTDPHVAMHAITLLDACVNNCGKPFKLEVASRDFEQVFKKLLQRSHPKVREKLKELLKGWAGGEFKGDQQLNLIPSLYVTLKREGMDFSTNEPGAVSKTRNVPHDPNVVSSQQEEDDIAKAIQMSLQETKASAQTKQAATKNQQQPQSQQGLYPSTSLGMTTNSEPVKATSPNNNNNGFKEPRKARALYDFEAAEDNEMTFKTGEIVIITDDSDENWWKGSNHRGEGLFPSNFVTTDLEAEPEEDIEGKRRRSVQFNDSVQIKSLLEEEQQQEQEVIQAQTEIDESKIDHVLMMLHEADPTNGETDPPELPGCEDQVNQMTPMIDAELEGVDRRLAQLTRLSTELVDALNLYHQLMRETALYGPPATSNPSSMYGGPAAPPQSFGIQTQQPMYGGGVSSAVSGYNSNNMPPMMVSAAGPYSWNPSAVSAPPPPTPTPTLPGLTAGTTSIDPSHQQQQPSYYTPTSSQPSVQMGNIQNGYPYNPGQSSSSDFQVQQNIEGAPIYSSN